MQTGLKVKMPSWTRVHSEELDLRRAAVEAALYFLLRHHRVFPFLLLPGSQPEVVSEQAQGTRAPVS